VGWHNPEMKTPHANALAKEGIILEKSYVFMYCAPTRSAIMWVSSSVPREHAGVVRP
jgi:arylsulfatase A-like enzyme